MKEKKLPKAVAKRYGHKSHTHWDSLVRQFARTGFFEWRERIEKRFEQRKIK